MNNLRKPCMAFVLALTLSSAALAGTIDCPGIIQPPPKPEETASEVNITVKDALLILIEVVLVP